MTTQLYIKICNYLRDKIAGTQWEGHVFTVGGCCRDMVLNVPIHDVDLAVNLSNGGVEFALWLHKMRLTTGRPTLFERYGTAMLRLKAFPQDDIEIVQTRAEKYTDRNSRNPETAFGSLKDDCLRRDLTINALYYDLTNEKLLDLTGRSLSDIINNVIATPQDPDSTYDDDPIRILRTIRFASNLGWKIPDHIFKAMCANSSRLNIIKPERLRGEFEKILLSKNVGKALDLLRSCGAMNHIVPETLPLSSHQYSKDYPDTAWQHTLRTLENLPQNLTLRWAALLDDLALPEYAQKPAKEHALKAAEAALPALMRLKYHQPLLKDVMFLCANHEIARYWGKLSENMEDRDLRRLQYICGRQDKLDALLTLIDADNKALPADSCMPEQISYIRARDKELIENGTAMYSYHLPFAERRIKKLLHIEPGPLVEDTLEYMMTQAFANPRLTRQDFERLVSTYTPKEPEAYYNLLVNEIRPSGKKSRSHQARNSKSRRKAHTPPAKDTAKNTSKNTSKNRPNRRRRRYNRQRKTTDPK